MFRLFSTLAAVVIAGCATHQRPEAPERWLTKHKTEHHYHESELAPAQRVREVPDRYRAEAVASLRKEPFRRLTDAEFAKYAPGDTMERLPGQFVFLLRAVRPADRKYRLQVYRDHVPHHGHHHPPVEISTLARAGAQAPAFPPLEKTAVIYIDSRPTDKLNVDYMLGGKKH